MAEKVWFTLREVHEETGLSWDLIRSRARRKTLPTRRRDGVRQVHRDDLEKLKHESETGVRVGTESNSTNVPVNKVIGDAQALLAGDTPEETEETRLRRSLVESQSQERQLRQLLAQYNERARLEDRIESQIRRSLESNPYAPMLVEPTLYEDDETLDDAAHEMLLLVSDAHYPEFVNPEEALGIEYGPEIVRKRMEYIIDRTVRLLTLHQQNYPIGKLTIGVLGDMLSGNIHEELEVTNAMPMGDALTGMSYMLFDMGRILAQHVPVEMIIMPGNHPRMTKKPRNKQKWDNFEYIMGKMVEALAGDQFTVTVPKDIIYTHRIFDWNIGMTHGDGSKAASFAGIPFYGLKQRSQATQAMRSTLGFERLDMLCMGHFHQHLMWTEGDCQIILNGAIKGGDEYSIVTRSSATEPVQVLLTLHEEHGHINTEKIPLGDVV
jgi:predicted phosphodiesterase